VVPAEVPDSAASDPARERPPDASEGASTRDLRIRVGIAVAAGDRGWGLEGASALQVQEAEREGCDVAWIVARPPAREHSAIQCAAAALALTRRIGIVVDGVAWPPRSWLRCAEDLASLDALSGGRVEAVLHLAPGATPDAVLEDLELVRRAGSEGAIEHRSARHQVDGVDVHPKPARVGGPRLWVSSDTSPLDLVFEVATLAGIGVVLDVRDVSDQALRLLAARESEGERLASPALALRAPGPAESPRVAEMRVRAESARRHLGWSAVAIDWIEGSPAGELHSDDRP